MSLPDDPKGARRASSVASVSTPSSLLAKLRAHLGGGNLLPPPPPGGTGEDDEEEGMLRMSFLDHLQELRTRIISMLVGLLVAFLLCLTFSNRVWTTLEQPGLAPRD